MKLVFLIISISLGLNVFSQPAKIVRLYNGNKGQVFVECITSGNKVQKFWPSCYFKSVTKLSDSIKIALIEQILNGIESDTLLSTHPVEALSYRYTGRFNKPPVSKLYSLQITSLLLINYLAFSSDAINYSPYPVLFDKKSKKEISLTGKELNEIIVYYKKWFKKIRKTGFQNYGSPLKGSKYEWYGSLFIKDMTWDSMPKWSEYYDCIVLQKEEGN